MDTTVTAADATAALDINVLFEATRGSGALERIAAELGIAAEEARRLLRLGGDLKHALVAAEDTAIGLPYDEAAALHGCTISAIKIVEAYPELRPRYRQDKLTGQLLHVTAAPTEGNVMNATTDYGAWSDFTNHYQPLDVVSDYLNEFAADYDVEAIVNDYVDAVNAALPDGVTLNGNLFFGPHPRPDDSSERIREAIESVDLAPIAARHER